MQIDLIEKFKNQNIEGIERHDFAEAYDNEDETFQMQKEDNLIVHVPSGKRIVFECSQAYFEPQESYFKLNKNSRCAYVQRALGTNWYEGHCMACINECIGKKLRIKPKKIVVSRDYYNK